MTITHLPPRPPGTLSPQAQVEVLHMVIDDLHAMETTATEAGLLGEVAARAQSRLDAVRLKLIAAADTGGVAQGEGLPTTADWLSTKTRTTRQESAQQAALAEALDGPEATLDSTRDALSDGHLSVAHARVIADAMKRLPAGLSAEDRARCEARLVADAARFDPAQLRRHARRVLAEVEPDPVIVDAHENAQLADEEDAAYTAASLTFHDTGDGTVTGRFTLPALQADILRKVIDAMTAPRRQHGRQDPTTRGRLDPAHARGLAFAQLLEHLPTDHLHGRATTQVTVVMDIDTLLDTARGHLKAAGLDTDRAISAGEARRVACNSTLTPVVLGRALSGASLVLDLGRTSRLFTDAQRRAIHATHTHCAARGCTRPIAWCELHHRTAWSRGGRTDLREAVPLCGWHHRKIHDHRHEPDWQADGTVTTRPRT